MSEGIEPAQRIAYRIDRIPCDGLRVMLATWLLAAASSGGFVHPAPEPGAGLPVSVHQARRERVPKELNGGVAAIGAQGLTQE